MELVVAEGGGRRIGAGLYSGLYGPVNRHDGTPWPNSKLYHRILTRSSKWSRNGHDLSAVAFYNFLLTMWLLTLVLAGTSRSGGPHH